MSDFIGDVPAAAREVADFYVGVDLLDWWDPRELTVRSHEKAMAHAEAAHARDRRPRCVLPTSIGYVVYPLRKSPAGSRGERSAGAGRGGTLSPAPAGQEGNGA